MGMVWLWELKSSFHGYSSHRNRRPESKRTTLRTPSQIPGYGTARLII